MRSISHRDVSIRMESNENGGVLDAFWRGYSCGMLKFLLRDGLVYLGDLNVYSDMDVKRWFGLVTRSYNFQGHGIGSLLLDRFLQEVERLRCCEIYALVSENDLAGSPFLLDWYCSRGFTIMESVDMNPFHLPCYPPSKSIYLNLNQHR